MIYSKEMKEIAVLREVKNESGKPTKTEMAILGFIGIWLLGVGLFYLGIFMPTVLGLFLKILVSVIGSLFVATGIFTISAPIIISFKK